MNEVRKAYFLASHQLSSRQIDRRQQENRVQPRVGLHFPPFLLHLHVSWKRTEYFKSLTKNSQDLKEVLVVDVERSYFCDSANNNIPYFSVEPACLK